MYVLCNKYASASPLLAQASEPKTKQSQSHLSHTEDVQNIVDILTEMETDSSATPVTALETGAMVGGHIRAIT
jgi:hypothetical protein